MATAERVPLGTSLTAAERTLVAHGFQCVPTTLTHVAGADMLREQAALGCRRERGGRIWSVSLVHADGRVTALHVGTGVRMLDHAGEEAA